MTRVWEIFDEGDTVEVFDHPAPGDVEVGIVRDFGDGEGCGPNGSDLEDSVTVGFFANGVEILVEVPASYVREVSR